MPREWDIKDLLLVGGQGSGKSSTIRYCIKLVCSIEDYLDMGISVVWTNDIRIIADKKFKHLFKGNKVIMLIIDDAMRKGLDSRRSMNSANVDMTSFFNTTRHHLEENFSKNGIIFVFFANQIYSRIDKSIRENAKIKIFTSYTDKKWFTNQFREKQTQTLREATFCGDIGSDFDKRAFNLLKLKTGETATINVPFVKKNELLAFLKRKGVKYAEVNRSLNKNDAIEELSQKILKKYPLPSDHDKKIIKAYLELQTEKLEKDYAIKFTGSDINKAINRAYFYESEGVCSGTEEKKPLRRNLTKKDRIIESFNVRNVNVLDSKTINEITKIDQNKINSYLAQYEDFIKVDHSLYKLRGSNHTEEDINRLKPKENVKTLIM
jgi:hypothetical protein